MVLSRKLVKLFPKATEIDRNTSRLTDATATSTYSIFVSDVNDNAPQFGQALYVVNVTEMDSSVANNTAMQITGLHINCFDRDEVISLCMFL